ncbi:MAG TPA: hypothetical protein VFQ38_15945 [Longimicrobiales bacterium]|nr:hypothetical protein [Longimicrobiales bacterium]
MTLRIGFAYNEKPAEGADPPSSAEEAEPPSSGDAGAARDRYAEWDDPATIAAVEAALRRLGEVVRLEATADFPQKLRDSRPDIVFNIAEGLHGPNRESHVPAICEFFDIPYTGSDPLALGLALDKRRAKEIFRIRDVPTPDWLVVTPETLPRGEVPLPAMVKPLHEGSSMGIPDHSLCSSEAQVRRRVREIRDLYGQPALVEAFLPGREFTVAILGNGAAARALPIVEIRFDSLPSGSAPIYGYEAKWVWDRPEAPLEIFRCPARVEPRLGRAIEEAALGAFHALGCRDWSRVDVRLDARGAPQVIEVNPLPGILPDPEQNSCFPKAARAAGIGYDELMTRVLELALERYGLRP